MSYLGAGLTSSTARTRLVEKIKAEGLAKDEVLDILRDVPRHSFVDEAIAHRAYDDTTLPIGHQQTISQPSVVAIMSEAVAGVRNRNRVLEIGTGCGYQTAILAHLFHEVYTVERIQPLTIRAQQHLSNLGYQNIHFKFDDGYLGWPEQAPFDAIIGAAASDNIPDALTEQLAIGARLVLPVESAFESFQELTQIERVGESFVRKHLCRVRFVPMLTGTVK